MDLTEKAREVFASDLFATKLAGITIDEVVTDYAKCSMRITENHLNAEGYIMGGAIFTLADFTFAVAANSAFPVTVTLSSNINFLVGSKSPILFAESHCDRRGSAICAFTTTVTDDKNNTIALVTSNGYRHLR
ncbi:MAG: PaaI family thioesterase [Clostridia bacterium]